MTPAKLTRLQAIERELRRLRKAMPDAIKLRVENALLVATTSRLIGENDRLRTRLPAPPDNGGLVKKGI